MSDPRQNTNDPYECVEDNDNDGDKEEMILKIGILGDIEVGKSSFMQRYVCNSFQYESYGYYNNSPGSVLFLEKQISMKHVNLFLDLWCSTTAISYDSSLSLICNEANVILFMFSLTNKQSLYSIKSWYDKSLKCNKQFIPILVGTKYDVIQENIASNNPSSHLYLDEYHKIARIARKYAMKMKASLIFTSSKENININHVIKCCVAKVFNIKLKLKEYHWNTLKALREHNVSKLLKIWSNHKKMTHLIAGYLKMEQITDHITPIIIELMANYCEYNLSTKSTKSHRKKRRKSSKISKSQKHHQKSSNLSKKSTKHRQTSSNISNVSSDISSNISSNLSLDIQQHEGYDMVIEGEQIL